MYKSQLYVLGGTGAPAATSGTVPPTGLAAVTGLAIVLRAGNIFVLIHVSVSIAEPKKKDRK